MQVVTLATNFHIVSYQKLTEHGFHIFQQLKIIFLYTFASETQMADIIFKLMHCS